MLLYFMEGVVRATSDPGVSAYVAWVEVMLSTVFFWCAVLYVRPAKRAYKAAKSRDEAARAAQAKRSSAANDDTV
ncbi:Predicted membrane protein [Mycobacteroides abscessus subsp. abscessus]|nr:Predicted membrane protein [Mycobacteroides abscessus subsp. abscessus]